jgi:uncharacterized RDD family membrane protein YckC
VSLAEERTGRVAGKARSAVHQAREIATRVHGEAQPPAAVPSYQGLVTRTIAFALDAATINLAALAVGTAVGLAISVLDLPSGVESAAIAVGGAAYVVWTIAYFVACWSSTGQTPGNRLLHIRVCDADDGTTLSEGRAFLRLVFLVLAALPLFAGFLPILVDDRRRGVHDMLAGTVVVGTDPPEPQRAKSGPPAAPEA